MHSLLTEVDIIFELLDEHNYIAIFLHPKHMNMSKFARISFFLNDCINTFLYFELTESLFVNRKFEILSRLHLILSNMKLISSINGIIDSCNEESQRKKAQVIK